MPHYRGLITALVVAIAAVLTIGAASHAGAAGRGEAQPARALHSEFELEQGAPGGGSGDDQGDDEGGDHACSEHAKLLRKACMADRKDTLLVHRADCLYVTPAEDEADCLDEADEEAEELAEECAEIYEARLDLCGELGEQRFDIEFDPADFVDPNEIGGELDGAIEPNPYWPLNAGHTQVTLGEGEVVVLIVTDEVVDVGGLPCRVIRDLAFEEAMNDEGEYEYEAVEVTRDWYAQHVNGDVIYCGENTFEVEDGLVDNTDGSFAHGKDRARAGFLLRRFPVVGTADRQEMASDEAEDFVRYVSLASTPSEAEGGDSSAYPCNGGCLQTFEQNPRDPAGAEYKYYLEGVGFVLATKLEDGEPTGEREEVACSGESIEILNDEACGIGDPDALFEALCEWAPDALCFD